MSQLNGLKVLELASVLAGPGVGQFFAELGAVVIKIENLRTGGDVTRSWKLASEETDDRSAYFCSVNWGKRSLAVDLSKPKGQEIIQSLAMKSDVVIASYKPGDATRLGVDYQTLSRLNSRLIYGEITGYGSENPRVGYDAIIQAEAGFMHMNGEPEGKSLKMPVALMDILAGHQLKEGLLLALLERMSTGKGKLVQVSLIESAISSLANQASNYLVASLIPQKQGSAHPNIAPYGDIFLTHDGKEILLAVGTNQQFAALCETLMAPDISTDNRFKTNQLRVKNRSGLTQVLADEFQKFDSQSLIDQLISRQVPVALIKNVKEALGLPEARPLMLEADGLKGIRSFAVKNLQFSHLLPPPHFGEHTNEILIDFLNLSPENVESCRKIGIIV